MAQHLIPCDRDQQFLMPLDMRDWLPSDDLAWFILEAVEELDLSAFYAAYRQDGQGAAAHDPQMMVALLLYAYAVGEPSTRKIERLTSRDVGFRVIAANQAPDHTTINRFRSRHATALAELFSQVLVLCERAGLLGTGLIAVDGTKLAADASLAANRSYEQVKADVERYLREADETDRAEDELYGEARGDELPAGLRTRAGRREALERAKAQLEAEQAALVAEAEDKRRDYEQRIERSGRRPPGPPPSGSPHREKQRKLATAKRNLTDPDSRIVRDKGALIQGYNAQAVVCETQVIVAADLTNEANDTRQPEPMAELATEELERIDAAERPHTLLADSGYWNQAQMTAARAGGLETIIPTKAIDRTRARKIAARQGPEAERMDRLLATDEGMALYRRRKQIVEPVFAHIKHLRGLRRLSRRGLEAGRAEWRLIAATHNLLKLYRAPIAA